MYVPDLRNHGKSFHTDTHNYQSMEGDVLHFADTIGMSRLLILGHSMGGKVAMEFALEHPERTEALIIEDMVPGKTSPQFRRHLDLLMDIDLQNIGSRRSAEEKLMSIIDDRLVVLFLLKNLKRGQDGLFSWKANISSLSKNYNVIWDELPPGRTWDGPVLVMRGGQSNIVADERFEEIFDYFPRAKIVTINESGHWIHSEAFSEFTQTVEEFLLEISH